MLTGKTLCETLMTELNDIELRLEALEDANRANH